MKLKVLALCCLCLTWTHGNAQQSKTPQKNIWSSLDNHKAAPEWFKDAKLGIYFHWGVYTVPAYGNEWYPYHMYRKDSEYFKHHKAKYGDQSKFGYHEFVPMFKAEKFNAKEWTQLFKKAGARFAGPVAQHHDGFAMWDSKVNPWNAKNKGPKKDITGLLEKEIKNEGMKFITTFHHARNLQRYSNKKVKGFASHFTYNKDWHTSTINTELKKLYGNVDKNWFHQYWYDQIDEVVTQYQPDIIWFDSWLDFIPEDLRFKMVANYLNKSASNNQEVVIAYKQNDIPKHIGVKDIEQGGKRDVTEKTWMTDITLSNKSWCYVKGQTYKPTALVIRNFIDVISKNGVVLLNISPKADGSIPQVQKDILLEMGAWFDIHGEAIFNTRPWIMYGFGNAKADSGKHGGQSATVKYTASDIRFTQSKDKKTLYLFSLGVPKQGWTEKYYLMAEHRYFPNQKIKNVSLLETKETLEYDLDGYGFSIKYPNTSKLNTFASVVKIEFE
ncbi:alpha-L-fucosidase [Wenyingzhuangia sp. IMCC45574]